MRPLTAGLLAILNGVVALVAALLSLTAETPMMTEVDPLPAYLLLALGAIVSGNGVALVAGLRVPMTPQGVAMLLYGGLMILVGATMVATDLFAMGMRAGSAAAMFVLGGLMVVSGVLMVRGPTMRPAG